MSLSSSHAGMDLPIASQMLLPLSHQEHLNTWALRIILLYVHAVLILDAKECSLILRILTCRCLTPPFGLNPSLVCINRLLFNVNTSPGCKRNLSYIDIYSHNLLYQSYWDGLKWLYIHVEYQQSIIERLIYLEF